MTSLVNRQHSIEARCIDADCGEFKTLTVDGVPVTGGGVPAPFISLEDTVTPANFIVQQNVAAGGSFIPEALVVGATSADGNDGTNSVRLIFDPSADTGCNGALRAGSATGTQWNVANRGDTSVAFGLNNTATAPRSSVLGGQTNTIACANGTANRNSVIGGGLSNSMTGVDTNARASNVIGGGTSNAIENADTCVIGGGNTNAITRFGTPTASFLSNCAILGGNGNSIYNGSSSSEVASSSIVGGSGNTILDDVASVICGGGSGTIRAGGGTNFMGAGANCQITHQESSVVCGGNGCNIFSFDTGSGTYNAILGGSGNSIRTGNADGHINNSAILGGAQNSILTGFGGPVTITGNLVGGVNAEVTELSNCFVWGDGTTGLGIGSTKANTSSQFVIGASASTGLCLGSPSGQGARYPPITTASMTPDTWVPITVNGTLYKLMLHT
jgi:hypothetical protein